jgi:hypothetical protein
MVGGFCPSYKMRQFAELEGSATRGLPAITDEKQLPLEQNPVLLINIPTIGFQLFGKRRYTHSVTLPTDTCSSYLFKSWYLQYISPKRQNQRHPLTLQQYSPPPTPDSQRDTVS